jgi:hypothetical protein
MRIIKNVKNIISIPEREAHKKCPSKIQIREEKNEIIRFLERKKESL